MSARSIGESTCSARSVEELKNLLIELETAKIEKRFELKVSIENYNDVVISLVNQIASRVRQMGSEMDVFINSLEMEFKSSEIDSFIVLEESFDKKDIGLYFDGGLEAYTLAETLFAQLQIDDIIEQINSTGASPFERYLMAYDFITSRVYKEYQQGSAKSRDLIAVMNGDNIVCVGYAKLMDRLCKGIGIESYYQPVRVYDGKGNDLGGHQNNIIYLKDDKYGIDGFYYSDACWDSVSKTGQHRRFLNHCLIPLSDKDRFKDTRIEIGTYRRVKGIKLKSFYEPVPSKYDVARNFDKASYKMEFRREAAEALEFAESIVLDSKKRTSACEKLRKIFMAEGIPFDIYGAEPDYIRLVSKECSYEYMLALLMEQPVNKKELSICSEMMRNFFLNDGAGLSERSTIVRAPKDIYGKLEYLVSKKNEKRIGSDEPQSPFDWRNVKEQLEILKMAEFMVSRIKRTVKPGKPISVEQYMLALKNNFLMQGLDEKFAEYQAGLIIDSSIRNSEFIFDGTASNSFRREALARRAEQQGTGLGE